jgi:hypothetical protein
MVNGVESIVGIGSRQRVVDSAAGAGLALPTDAAREVALGIGVHEQHTLLADRERCGQVDGSRGLAHAPLLVGDRDDPPHLLFLSYDLNWRGSARSVFAKSISRPSDLVNPK